MTVYIVTMTMAVDTHVDVTPLERTRRGRERELGRKPLRVVVVVGVVVARERGRGQAEDRERGGEGLHRRGSRRGCESERSLPLQIAVIKQRARLLGAGAHMAQIDGPCRNSFEIWRRYHPAPLCAFSSALIQRSHDLARDLGESPLPVDLEPRRISSIRISNT
jgi:hypothetical protein